MLYLGSLSYVHAWLVTPHHRGGRNSSPALRLSCEGISCGTGLRRGSTRCPYLPASKVTPKRWPSICISDPLKSTCAIPGLSPLSVWCRIAAMTDHAIQPDDNTSPNKPSQLCKICDQIGTGNTRWLVNMEKDSDLGLGLGVYIHRRDLHSLKASATNGCGLCRFILSTVLTSHDARHVQTLSDDIIQDCEVSPKMKIKKSDIKRILRRHGDELPEAMAFNLPITFKNPADLQGLDRLAKLCGNGRIILICTTYTNLLPCNIRAVVLYPFGPLDIQDIRTPFIAGRPFELVPRIGM